MVPFSIAWNSKNPIGKYLTSCVSQYLLWMNSLLHAVTSQKDTRVETRIIKITSKLLIHISFMVEFQRTSTFPMLEVKLVWIFSAVCQRREASQNIKVKACLNYFMNAVPSNYFTCFPRCLLCIYYHVGVLVYLCVQILWWNACLFKYIHRLVNF